MPTMVFLVKRKWEFMIAFLTFLKCSREMQSRHHPAVKWESSQEQRDSNLSLSVYMLESITWFNSYNPHQVCLACSRSYIIIKYNLVSA